MNVYGCKTEAGIKGAKRECEATRRGQGKNDRGMLTADKGHGRDGEREGRRSKRRAVK